MTSLSWRNRIGAQQLEHSRHVFAFQCTLFETNMCHSRRGLLYESTDIITTVYIDASLEKLASKRVHITAARWIRVPGGEHSLV